MKKILSLAAQRENIMTGTTTINISTTLYNQAADYARQHNTSVERMMENYIVTLMTFMQNENNTPEFIDHAVIKDGVLQVTPDLQKEIEETEKGNNVSMSEFKTMFSKWLE